MIGARRPGARRWARAIATAAALAAAACGPEPEPLVPPPPLVADPPVATAAPVIPTIPAPATTPASLAELLSGEAMMRHVLRLTAADMRGRGSATPEERHAALYLAAALDAARIAPPTADGRFHRFQFRERKKGPRLESQNVCGWIPGSKPELASEVVVLGAHYDHVGVIKGKVYPGAEDNASGTALVLQVATALAGDRGGLGRSVLVIFFGSEELGLIGSKAFVRKPSLPLARMVSMINVDMIGRALADRGELAAGKALMGIHAASSVGIHGARGRPVLRRMVDEAFASAGVRVLAAEDFPEPLASIIEKQTAGRTDHSTFEKAGVPGLFFTSAESDDYHEPTDTPDTLEPEVLAARARAIHRLVLDLSHAPRADLRR